MGIYSTNSRWHKALQHFEDFCISFPPGLRHRSRFCLILFILAASSLAACSNLEENLASVLPGLSRAEVVELLGEPDEVNVSTLPSGPFFGPQEGLLGLLPAGAGYEEWVYKVVQDDFYVWFGGESQRAQDWLVILTARYPSDAVW